LEDPQCTHTKVGTKHREEAVKECERPADFGDWTRLKWNIKRRVGELTEKDNDLEDDQQAGHHGPEGPSGLVRDGASPTQPHFVSFNFRT